MQLLASPAKYCLNFLIRGEANIPHDVFTGLLERSFKNHIINGASVGKACLREMFRNGWNWATFGKGRDGLAISDTKCVVGMMEGQHCDGTKDLCELGLVIFKP